MNLLALPRLPRLVVPLLFGILLQACTTIKVDHLPPADTLPLVDESGSSDTMYKIQAGDELQVKFFYAHELDETLKVRPDGYISLQLVDDVKAAGLSPKDLDDVLTRLYAEHVRNPVLSVIVRSFSGFRAYVGGEVAVPQALALDGGVTPLQAIYRTGGVRPTGYMQSVVLIRKGPDGRPLPYRLDLSDEAISEGRRDLRVALLPSDVIYVPRSPIANANRFVQQYISDLVLFRGMQLGFNVDYLYNRTKNETPVVP